MLHDTGVETKSDALKGRKIAFGVCGGIGAVEAVKLIRELRRYQAEITAFLTDDALRFIQPLALEWATQRPVVAEVGPHVEHLEAFDAAVVAPLTLHTTTKIALGLCDNAVTLMVATQLGLKRPIGLVPTMNEARSKHPLYRGYAERLESWGAQFFVQATVEGRWKMPCEVEFGEWMQKVCG